MATKTIRLFAKDGQSSKLDGSFASMLSQFEQKVQTDVIASAVYAGAKVLTDELVVNVNKLGRKKGNLHGAIFTYHDDKRSSKVKHVYLIGVNKVKAPHWFNVEYGHWRYNVFAGGRWQKSKSKKNARGPGAHDLPGALHPPRFVPAHPYLRPTASRFPAAFAAAKARFAQRLAEVMK